MDMSNVTRSMWIVIGGTVATLLGTLILDWYSVSASVTLQGVGTIHGPSASFSAWDTGSIGKLAVLGSLVMLAGVVLLFVPNVDLPFPLPMALLAVSAFTALMVVIKFLDVHSDTSLGLWLSLVGAVVAAYGAYEMGGRFSMSSSTG